MRADPKATTAIILELRKPLQKDRYPVKLRITYKRQRRYYTLKDKKKKSLAFTKEEFQKIRGERPRDSYKETALHLNELEKKAIYDIGKLPVFTFEAFERRYFSKTTDETDLFSILQSRADTLEKEKRISTANSFNNVLHSLKAFTGKDKLLFENVDVPFLNKYEKWMLKEENGLTTVGIYLRNVRAAFNKAIKDDIIDTSLYPFGDGKYEIPTGRNIKKALTIKDVGLIAKYSAVKGSSEERYRDYWLFGYLCNGINVKDIARMKYSNIDNDTITITRAKTEAERRKQPKPITIVITPLMSQIIAAWGNKPSSTDQYVFPILQAGLTPKQEHQKIQQTTKQINKYIARIATAVGIKQSVTSYTARHSFATVLKRSGASTEFISESLGHSSMTTTENYLADFEIEEKRKWAEKLDKF